MASVWTNSEIDGFIANLKAAYTALTSGVQSYEINTGGSVRKLTRMNLKDIKDELLYWQNEKLKNETDQSGLNVKFGRMPC